MIQEIIDEIVRNARIAHIPMEAKCRLATVTLQKKLDDLYNSRVLRIPLIGIIYAEDDEFLRYSVFKPETLDEIKEKDYDYYVRK